MRDILTLQKIHLQGCHTCEQDRKCSNKQKLTIIYLSTSEGNQSSYEQLVNVKDLL